jgi:DNA gyrase subunit A
VPVEGIRVVGRNSQGVTVFSTRDKEKVVSVEHIEGEDGAEAEGIDDAMTEGGEAGEE